MHDEGVRKKNITIFIRDIKDKLRQEFAQHANQFQDNLAEVSLAMANLEGELEVFLAILTAGTT
jgi:ABC-type Zn uptake system ZnuABC Zn-binding protein ZnuA